MKFSSITFLWVMAICFACNQPAPPTQKPVPDVNVVSVGVASVPVIKDYVGQTYGKADIAIQSRVDGWITGIYFKEGSFVKQGQLLYTIDDQPIQTRIDAANARLAQVNTQLVKAKSDLERVEPLTAMNALSKRDLDAARAAYDAAKSELEVAKAGLQNSKIELSYTRITAPVSGYIGISKYQIGDYVGRMGAGALNTVSNTEKIRVRFSVTEAEFLTYLKSVSEKKKNALEVSRPVKLLLSDGTDYTETGVIDLANREIDPATGSIIVQAIFSNPLGILRPGQYVKLRMQTGFFQDAILIPQQAVIALQNMYQVLLLTDSSTVAPTLIKPGMRVGANWIISEGLKAGNKVAIVGNASIKPNSKVKPVDFPWNYTSTLPR